MMLTFENELCRILEEKLGKDRSRKDLLHSRKIPRPFPAGGVESIVRREKTGRIGGNKNCRKSVTVCVPHEQQHVKFKRSFL